MGEPTRDDLREAAEAAPTLIYPDGDGGVEFVPVTDEAIIRVVDAMQKANGWTPKEGDNLYEAICNVLALLGEGAT